MIEDLRRIALEKLEGHQKNPTVLLPDGRRIPVWYENNDQLISLDSLLDSLEEGIQRIARINIPLLDRITAFFIVNENMPNPHEPNTFCTGYRRKDWLRAGETVIQLYPFAFETEQYHEGLPGVPRSVGAVIHEIGHEIDRFPEILIRWCEETGWQKLAIPEIIPVQDGTQITKKYYHISLRDKGWFPTRYASHSATENFSESLVAFLYGCPLSQNRRNFFESLQKFFYKQPTNLRSGFLGEVK